MNPVRHLAPALAVLLCSTSALAGEEFDDLRPDGLSAREYGILPGLKSVNRVELDLTRFFRFFSGDSLEWGNNRFAVPLRQETWRLDSQHSLLVNALAIEWQHSMNAANLLTLSARYGDSLSNDPELPNVSGKTATLSWNSLFGGESRVSGRFYMGDEEAQSVTSSEHRYFGMHFEGRYALWRDHTPFASLLWQRNYYEALDNAGLNGSLLRHDSFSRLAAGWNWQVTPGWDMRAEANYRLSVDSVDAVDVDRTQLYFSTHYGFR